jgi:hypothetical protein
MYRKKQKQLIMTQTIHIDKVNKTITVVKVVGLANKKSTETIYNYGISRYVKNLAEAIIEVKKYHPNAILNN